MKSLFLACHQYNQSINQSNLSSANISGKARRSGATAELGACHETFEYIHYMYTY